MAKDEFHHSRFLHEKSLSISLISQYTISLILFGIMTVTAEALYGATAAALVIVAWFLYIAAFTIRAVYRRIPVRKGAVMVGAVRSTMLQSDVHGWISIRGNKSDLAREKNFRHELVEKPVDLKKYINGKSNRNVFICGMSGAGKSYLMRYLLEKFSNQKIIFSFKPNDEYLKLGYPIVDMSKALPDPFKDNEEFVNAFLITFPINTPGITAQYIPGFVRSLSKSSRTWQEFNSNLANTLVRTRDHIQKSSLLFIQENIKSLISESGSVIEITDGNMVFDFSSLNQDSKTFYAELLLRRLWLQIISGKKDDVLICVDEAHRLLHNFQNYESIYIEMAREIRAFGMLWASTQNFSDMHDDIRTQFATQFIFNTNHPKDINALKSVEEKLSWSVSTLPLHNFTDARYKEIHYLIPEFTLHYKPKSIAPVYVEGLKQEMITGGTKRIDFEHEIWAILHAKGSAYTNQISKLVAEKYGIALDKAEVKVMEVLEEMRRSGKIDNIQMQIKGRNITLYYIRGSNISSIHTQMSRKVVNDLRVKGIKIIKIAKSGSHPPSADIETPELDIEIETGLKHKKSDLKERLDITQKRTVIIVPDETIKRKYASLLTAKVDVVIMDEFVEYLSNIQPEGGKEDLRV